MNSNNQTKPNKNQRQRNQYDSDEGDSQILPTSTGRSLGQNNKTKEKTEINQPKGQKLSLSEEFENFSDKQIESLKKRFDKISTKGHMTFKNFQESLGIFGVPQATFLSERIYRVIDTNRTNQVSFNDFVKYLSILINGTVKQKADMGFRFLDFDQQGVVSASDFRKLITELVMFWNYLTGSRVQPDQEYVDKLLSCFAFNSSEEITFQSYYLNYEKLNDLMDWYEFFNPEQKIKQFIKARTEKKQRQRIFDIKKPAKKSHLDTSMNILQESAFDCLIQIKDTKRSTSAIKQNEMSYQQHSQFINYFNTNDVTFEGPFYISKPQESKAGDEDPSNEVLELNQKIASQQENLSAILKREELNLSRNTQFTNQSFLNELDEKIMKMLSIIKEEQFTTLSRQQSLHKQQFESNQKLMQDIGNIQITPKKQEEEKDQNQINIQEVPKPHRRVTMANVPIKQSKMKKNISIYFGHPNWNLILNMMIGIRTAIKQLQPLDYFSALKSDEFSTKHCHDIITQRSNNFDFRKAFKFVDYSAPIFERIRNKFEVSQSSYLRSVGPENMLGSLIMGRLSSLTELSSSGKSGSFFYFTEDSKYMIKTISKNEKQFLRKIIKNYFTHIMENENTLISRIFGLHSMKIYQTKSKISKIYLVVITNIFTAPVEIDVRYDIKGSLYGRKTRVQKDQIYDKNIALKDLDLLDDKFKLNLNEEENILLKQQIESDAEFFQTNGVIDYSLLIGIHKISTKQRQIEYQKVRPEFEKKFTSQKFYEKDIGGMLSSNNSCIYYIGIIDILTEYNTKKKMEYQMKSTFVDSTISCVPPNHYAQRFKKFIFKELF